VTFRYDDDVDFEPEEIEAPKRRRWLPYAVVAMLAVTGSASAFLWRAYGNTGLSLPSFGSSPPADAGDKVVMLKDLQAFQQPIVAQTQAATQLLAAQQAEIKRLSDQMAALNAKLDALQHSVASVQPPAAATETGCAAASAKETGGTQARRSEPRRSASASAASIEPLIAGGLRIRIGDVGKYVRLDRCVWTALVLVDRKPHEQRMAP
jgi:uncharacterized coiled-coil protein SlyX